MKLQYLTFVLILHFMSACAMEDNQPKITVQCGDKSFQVDSVVIQFSQTLKDMLEGSDGNSMAFDQAGVEKIAEVLEYILPFLSDLAHHHDIEKVQNNLFTMPVDELARVVEYANFMNAPLLMNLGLEILSTRITSPTELQRFMHNADYVNRLQLSPQICHETANMLIARLPLDSNIFKYIPISEPHHLSGTGKQKLHIQWSPDGTQLAVGASKEDCIMWDEGLIPETIDRGQAATIWSKNWKDGKIAFVFEGEKVRIIDAKTGQVWTDLAGHREYITCLTWSPNGNVLASGAADDTVILWHVKNGDSIMRTTQQDKIDALAWHPRGTILAFATYNADRLMAPWGTPVIKLWDINNNTIIKELYPAHYGWNLLPLRWSPDGNYLACGQNNGTVLVWDKVDYAKKKLSVDHGMIVALSWSPDSSKIAAANRQGIDLWDVKTKTFLRTLPIPKDICIQSIDWSCNNNLAAGCDDGSVLIWNLENLTHEIVQGLSLQEILLLNVLHTKGFTTKLLEQKSHLKQLFEQLPEPLKTSIGTIRNRSHTFENMCKKVGIGAAIFTVVGLCTLLSAEPIMDLVS